MADYTRKKKAPVSGAQIQEEKKKVMDGSIHFFHKI